MKSVHELMQEIPELTSLLYDLHLMPEEVKEGSVNKTVMINIAVHMGKLTERLKNESPKWFSIKEKSAPILHVIRVKNNEKVTNAYREGYEKWFQASNNAPLDFTPTEWAYFP